jgi:hypothetical protein
MLPIRHDVMIANAVLEARINAIEPIVLIRPFVHVIQAGDKMTGVVLRLPEILPPGNYFGSLKIGEETHPIEVIVEPRQQLTLIPGSLSVTASPGHDEVIDVVVTNRGNIPAVIPQEGVVNLLDSDALSSAVHLAVSHHEGGQERINRFADTMAENIVAAQVSLRSGGGTIGPGESRRLTAQVRFPKSLQAGHSYRGAWELPHARYVVQVYVPAAAAPREVKAS